MVVLNEELVLQKTRSENLASVRNLNLWGSDLSDVSILQVPMHSATVHVYKCCDLHRHAWAEDQPQAIHVCMCTRVCTGMCVCVCMCMCMCVCVCLFVSFQLYACIHVCVCMLLCVDMCARGCIPVCACAYVYACLSVCVYMYVRVCEC